MQEIEVVVDAFAERVDDRGELALGIGDQVAPAPTVRLEDLEVVAARSADSLGGVEADRRAFTLRAHRRHPLAHRE